jgi:hypothetical protein
MHAPHPRVVREIVVPVEGGTVTCPHGASVPGCSEGRTAKDLILVLSVFDDGVAETRTLRVAVVADGEEDPAWGGYVGTCNPSGKKLVHVFVETPHDR